jgi:PPOX class probable F420-dependent enzyme
MKDLIPDSHADLLGWDARALAFVATIGPEGEPHNSPVWFEWDGTHIKFSLTTARQKYRNLQADKRVALAVVDDADPYRYLEVRGEVDEFEPDPDIDFISRMAQKYLGRERYPWHRPGDERVVVKVLPTRVSGMG